VLGLSVDDRHDRDQVVRVMKTFSYPAALLASARVNGFGSPMGLPETWVIDSAGMVRARLLSGLTEQSLAQAVLPLLPQAAAAAQPPGAAPAQR
jgi:hypothetical protein